MRGPNTIQFEITDDCNLRCLHCYHLDNTEEVEIKFSEANKEKIMKIAQKIVELRVFSVVITGGEPLTKKDLVLDLVEFFSDHNISVSLNTNLILLTENFLKDPRSKLITNFLVSCVSSNTKIYKEMTWNGNYNIFERNLLLLQKYNVRFGINMVVNTRNLHDIKNTAGHMHNLGVENFYVTPMSLNLYYPDLEHFLTKDQVISVVYDLIWIKDKLGMNIDILESLPKCLFPKEILDRKFSFLSRKCQAGVKTATVNYEGLVRPCSHNPAVYGNILEEDFSLIWDRMKDWRERKYIPVECGECKLSNEDCFGGCRMSAKAFDDEHKTNAVDPWFNCVFKEKIQLYNVMDLNSIELAINTIISLSGRLQNRLEEDGNYSINIAKKNVNMTVSPEVYKMLSYIEKKEKVSLINLCGTKEIFHSEKFQYIIKMLIAKKYLNIIA